MSKKGQKFKVYFNNFRQSSRRLPLGGQITILLFVLIFIPLILAISLLVIALSIIGSIIRIITGGGRNRNNRPVDQNQREQTSKYGQIEDVSYEEIPDDK